MKITRKHLRRLILKEMANMGMSPGSQYSDLIFHLTEFRDFLAMNGKYITEYNPQLLPELDRMIGWLQQGSTDSGLIRALKRMFLAGGFGYSSPKLDTMLNPIRSILSRM